jgi:hypothetical protein
MSVQSRGPYVLPVDVAPPFDLMALSMKTCCLSYFLGALLTGILSVNSPSFGCNGNGNCENAPGHNKVGAPGPIVGAGLPALAIGYGVYWLAKRRRKKNE